ncbi:unnamed protein product, partial [Mesorhabditis spiculigera]
MSAVEAEIVSPMADEMNTPTATDASTSSTSVRHSRRRRKQPMIDYDNPRFKGPVPEDLLACGQLHKRLMAKEAEHFTFYFYYPVDVERLGLVDYYDIVTQPIDLSTIRKKLDYRQYVNADEFMADLQLMLDNCFKYNPPFDMVHQAGRQLEKFIKEQWAQIYSAKPPNNNNNKATSSGTSRAEAIDDYRKQMEVWEKRRKDWLQRSAALRRELMALAPGALVPKALEKKIDQLIAEDAEHPEPKKVKLKKQDKPRAAYRLGNKGPALTMEEQQELREAVPRLTPREMHHFAELVDALEGSNIAEKTREVALDTSSLKPSTVRELLRHVRRVASEKSRAPRQQSSPGWECSTSHMPDLSESSSEDDDSFDRLTER